MTNEKPRRFTRKTGNGEHSTPRLPRKKGETKEEFYKRMNDLGYENGNLEKVPHHWTSDDSEMHPGKDSESCPWCKPTKRQLKAAENKKSGEIPNTSDSKEGSTTSKDTSSEGGSETSKDSEEQEKKVKVVDTKLPGGVGTTTVEMPDPELSDTIPANGDASADPKVRKKVTKAKKKKKKSKPDANSTSD
jgi:hypothetical protein